MSRMWRVDHQIGHSAQLDLEPMIEGAAAGVTEKNSHIHVDTSQQLLATQWRR